MSGQTEKRLRREIDHMQSRIDVLQFNLKQKQAEVSAHAERAALVTDLQARAVYADALLQVVEMELSERKFRRRTPEINDVRMVRELRRGHP